MYFVISKLEEAAFCRMQFLVNFGVSLDSIRLLQTNLDEGGNYDDVKEHCFKHIPFLQILMCFRYFTWADKKLNSYFYIENKDDISEDLLIDFKDPGNQGKPVAPKGLEQAKKQPAVIVKQEKLVSEHDYLFGKRREDDSRVIDVASTEDFPTLVVGGGPGGPLWAAP